MMCQTCGTDYGQPPRNIAELAESLGVKLHPWQETVLAELNMEPPTDSDPHGSDAARPIG